MYTIQQVTDYSKFKEEFNETDKDIFNVVALIAIQNKDILDLGCGDGRYVVHLKNLGARKVIGVDVNEKMIEMALKNKQEGLDIEFLVADGRKLPFEDGMFDLVFSNFVIHYFENTEEVFREIARVLKPGGYFVGTFNVADVSPGFEGLFNTKMPIRLGKGDKSVVVQNLIKSEKEISDAFQKNKLAVLDEREINHPNAVIDSSFENLNNVKKRVMCVLVKKQ